MSGGQPVFLLGPARSGTTLLQRIIGDHPDVATVAEPWLLTSMLGWTRDGRPPPYGGKIQATAMEEFVARLPRGQEDYLDWVGTSVRQLYERLAPDARWFLDKTPVYAHVAHLIAAAMPDARFVVLWRNPLAVVASSLETWNGGRWNPHKTELNSFVRIRALCGFVGVAPERTMSLRYEDLVKDPQRAWEGVARHLNLDASGVDLDRAVALQLHGSVGDPSGQHRYDRIESARAEGWATTWSTPVRRRWAAHYLDLLGPEALSTMGYTREEALAPLADQRGVPPWLTVRDVISSARGRRRQERRLRLYGGLDRATARARLRGEQVVEDVVWPAPWA